MAVWRSVAATSCKKNSELDSPCNTNCGRSHSDRPLVMSEFENEEMGAQL